jgi:predicted Zn finger-like uncharacterized protein
MRVQCPNCSIAYDVPEHLLVGRKALRCARCGTEWMPDEVAPKPVKTIPMSLTQPLPPIPAPGFAEPLSSPITLGPREEQTEREPLTAMERLARPVEPPRRTPWVGIAWVASLLVLGALAWGAVNWRADVMHAWPPSIRAYAALGLAPTSP